MKKPITWICIISITIFSASICGYFLFKFTKKISSNYSTERLSASKPQNDNPFNTTSSDDTKNNTLNIDISSNSSSDSNSNKNSNNTNQNQQNQAEIQQKQKEQTQQSIQNQAPKETVISTFSTKIYNHEKARQNNVKITCNSLNGKIIKNGEIFSFCSTVGPATQSKGYQKADIFDRNGNKLKGYGGGNCQVSTTLYNAVLKIPSIKITERHKHSSKVPYIAPGMDSAVAYGSCDLRFKNNTGHDIKLNVNCNENSVSVSILSLT